MTRRPEIDHPSALASRVKATSRRRLNISWEIFIQELLANLLPLAPAIIEFGMSSNIGEDTLAITAAMCAISLAVQTNSGIVRNFSMLVAVIASAFYGILASHGNLVFALHIASPPCIFLFILCSAIERSIHRKAAFLARHFI